jgi:predicted RNA binding protein YcfA (HicA-like mRNA interferase family)
VKPRKVYEKVLSGSRNIRFDDLCRLAEGFGFKLDRTSGSHHIYRYPTGLMLNLQPDRNRQAKPYQVRQLLGLVEQNGLTLDD